MYSQTIILIGDVLNPVFDTIWSVTPTLPFKYDKRYHCILSSNILLLVSGLEL